MISGINENPYATMDDSIHPLQEIPLAMLRLGKSYEQRTIINNNIAQEWLDCAINLCNDSNIFIDSFNPHPKIDRKIGAGFNTSVFTFCSDHREWVIKIGAGFAPVAGWLNPCSLEYAKWYAYNLEILRYAFDNKLEYLIPWPQYVLHARNAKNEYSTLIIQPHVSGGVCLENIDIRDINCRDHLLEQVLLFDYYIKEMYQYYKVIPDFGSRYNIVAKDIKGKPHLVMLDNGLIDFNAVSPVLNNWSMFIYKYRINNLINRLS